MSQEQLAINTRAGFIGIVGPANAGKSTLLNALLGTKLSIVSRKPQTTRERITGIVTHGDAQLIFVDTPGFVRDAGGAALTRFLRRNIEEAMDDIDVVVVVLDAPRCANSMSYLGSALKDLFGRAAQPDFVVLNKVDAMEKEQLLPLILRISEHFTTCTPDILPLSALKADGIEFFKDTLAKRLPESPFLYPEGTVSDRDQNFVLQEVVREKLFEQLNKELPYCAAVVVDSIERDNKVLQIAATIYVEKDSQKGIVVGKGGTKIKSIGTSARIDLEAMLEEKVCLKLQVAVEQDWTKTVRGLERVGLGRLG